MKTESDIKDAEVIEPVTAIATSIPTTVEQLAADERGMEIVERGIAILRTLRAASIALTYPHDWVLFKAEDRITGFCQESGCQRIRDLWGVEVYDLEDFIRTEDTVTKDFSYSITGSGFSKRTGQRVERITGTRYSYEDFIVHRRLKGLQIETEVKKAARANLNGNITRELAGFKSVPEEELNEVWIKAGMVSYKSTKLCPKGRGFGTADERAGGSSEKSGVDPQDVPTCGFCKDSPKLIFRPAKGERAAFWGCQNYNAHPSDKVFVDHAKLLEQIAKKKAEPAKKESK